MKLGKVVGEPTAGWIIYTGAMELVDGTTMRMPGTLITGVDGQEHGEQPTAGRHRGDATGRGDVHGS